MWEFVHGWRRKAGCVSLVMACLTCAAWVRSISVIDNFYIPQRDSFYSLESVAGTFRVSRFTPRMLEIPFQWNSNENIRTARIEPWWEASVEWSWDFGDFHAGVATIQVNRDEMRYRLWMIPYWSVILPLTVLSVYLILWKPRPKMESPAQN